MKHSAADLDILARTVWGEARGETWEGRLAVAYTVVNRAKARRWWGHMEDENIRNHSISAVCLYPAQFSCWSPGDPNRQKMERLTLAGDSMFRECLAAAVAAAYGLEVSPAGKATHYHVAGLDVFWARGKEPLVQIGAHVFYEGIK